MVADLHKMHLIKNVNGPLWKSKLRSSRSNVMKIAQLIVQVKYTLLKHVAEIIKV